MKSLVDYINESLNEKSDEINEAINKWDKLFKKYFGNDYRQHIATKTKLFDGEQDIDDDYIDDLTKKGWLTIDICPDDIASYIIVAVRPKSPSDKTYAEQAIKSLEDADKDELLDML